MIEQGVNVRHRIRPARQEDAGQLCRIYNHYVENTCISFEEAAVSVSEMARRVGEYSQEFPWLVLKCGSDVIGYAYASKWRVRPAYRFSVESSVYLDRAHTGQGLGSLLYENLLGQLSAMGVRVVIGGIALPNAASVNLHEKLGFEQVAQFKEVGFKQEKWIDVGYWQKNLAS